LTDLTLACKQSRRSHGNRTQVDFPEALITALFPHTGQPVGPPSQQLQKSCTCPIPSHFSSILHHEPLLHLVRCPPFPLLLGLYRPFRKCNHPKRLTPLKQLPGPQLRVKSRLLYEVEGCPESTLKHSKSRPPCRKYPLPRIRRNPRSQRRRHLSMLHYSPSLQLPQCSAARSPT
jgi:hypothetical protein